LGPGIAEPARANATGNTVVRRYIAAVLDNTVAIVLSLVAAKSVSDDLPAVQCLALVGTYLGYYLLSEGFVSRTPGKLLAGLVVIGVDGQRCSWGQVFIRTAFRVLEVNPVILGGIPAALGIVFSRRHQRFGDMVAHTIVVPSRRFSRKRRSATGQPTRPGA
jgi:uncharacterized RDD family membrane protein YckC